MFMLLFVSSVVIVFVSLISYLNGLYYETYWKKRGVKIYSKNKNLGILWDFIFKKESTVECVTSLYNKYIDEPAVGIGCLFVPGICVIDPVNIHHVLQDAAFSCRPVFINEHDFLGSNNILLINGIRWKLIRQKFTMFFTTAKLKNMFFYLNDIAKEFMKYLKRDNVKNEVTWQTMQKYSSAAATLSMFGIRTEKVFDSLFIEQVNRGLPPTIKIGIGIGAPFISKILRLKFFGKAEHFFMSATRQIIDQVKEDDISSCSFKDVYENMKKKKIVKDDDTGIQVEMSDEVIAANIFFFCSASILPTTATLFCALYELAKAPRLQMELRDEIDAVFAKYHDQITYDVIMEMSYLDNVCNETLRMYPGVSFVIRKCIKDAVLPVGNIKISKGTFLLVPTHQIQNDPKYITDPHIFNPARFTDGKLKKSPYFFPFGGGPRLCIGNRYTSLHMKTGIMQIVRNFKIETYLERNELKFLKNILSLEPNNMPLKLIPIENKT